MWRAKHLVVDIPDEHRATNRRELRLSKLCWCERNLMAAATGEGAEAHAPTASATVQYYGVATPAHPAPLSLAC